MEMTPLNPMVISELKKWHRSVCKAMRPSSACVYKSTIYRDVPYPVFHQIENIATTNMYKTQVCETSAAVTIKIGSVDKVLMLVVRFTVDWAQKLNIIWL